MTRSEIAARLHLWGRVLCRIGLHKRCPPSSFDSFGLVWWGMFGHRCITPHCSRCGREMK
jgi:hypothetical protein